MSEIVGFVGELTNRFHFAVRLYSDNAPMTSKRGENKEVRYEPQAGSVSDVLTTFCRHLCVIRVQTHDKMESISYFICLIRICKVSCFCK